MIKAILFDLDGTLLPMDQNVFLKSYFKGLVTKCANNDPARAKRLTDAIWAGTGAMLHNTGERTNEQIFWNTFDELTGDEFSECGVLFEDFYLNEFQKVQEVCGFNAKAKETIELAKALNYRTVLATNPMFPRIATESRVRWAGLDPSDFELITTFENSRHGKPQHEYYRDIANAISLPCDECLMVGNDVDDDLAAEALGMKVFLLTDCLINLKSKDITKYPSGDFDALMSFIKQLNN